LGKKGTLHPRTLAFIKKPLRGRKRGRMANTTGVYQERKKNNGYWNETERGRTAFLTGRKGTGGGKIEKE